LIFVRETLLGLSDDQISVVINHRFLLVSS
jgi:hypothetical protein